jgi:hypothetical protein
MATICNKGHIQLLYKYGPQREFGEAISDNISGTIVDGYRQFSRSLGSFTSLGRLPTFLDCLRWQGVGEILGRYLQYGKCAERNTCHSQRRVERPRYDQTYVVIMATVIANGRFLNSPLYGRDRTLDWLLEISGSGRLTRSRDRSACF